MRCSAAPATATAAGTAAATAPRRSRRRPESALARPAGRSAAARPLSAARGHARGNASRSSPNRSARRASCSRSSCGRCATPGEETRYEIVAGERRWRAAQMAGLHTVPAVVRDIPDEAAVAVALIENIQRENLNPIEEARSLQPARRGVRPHPCRCGRGGRAARAPPSPTCCGCSSCRGRCARCSSGASSTWGTRGRCSGCRSPELQLEIAQRAAKQGWSVRETESAVRR